MIKSIYRLKKNYLLINRYFIYPVFYIKWLLGSHKKTRELKAIKRAIFPVS